MSSSNYGRPGCKNAVWNKGKVIKGKDPTKYRNDAYHNEIHYSDHGTTTPYGWDIDHTIPKAKGGSNDISNLEPVHYSKNRSMGARMDDKDKTKWFAALEEYRGIQSNIKATHFKYEIGIQIIAKQTPISKGELAEILSIDRRNKKVKIRWIHGDYQENIEMTHSLFDNIPESRTKRKTAKYAQK
jgi:hypothetical protein